MKNTVSNDHAHNGAGKSANMQLHVEPIRIHIVLLLVMSVLCVVALSLINRRMDSELEEYTNVQARHHTISEVTLVTQKNLLRIQSGFEGVLLASSEAALNTSRDEVRDGLSVLRDAIVFFEHGGLFTETIAVNFEGLDKVLHTFNLDGPPAGRTLAAIEMRSSLGMLEKELESYTEFTRQRMQAKAPLDLSEQTSFLLLMHKKLRPFFVRASEHVNRIYVLNMRDLQRSHDARNRQLALHNVYLVSVAAITIALLLAVGWLVFRSANRILAERAAQSARILESNGLLRNEVLRRVNAQDALEKSEKTLRDIYELAPIGIYTSTPDGHLVAVNQAAATIYGYASPQEMLRAVTSISEQLYVSPDDRRALAAQLEDAGKVTNYEVRNRTREGRHIWVALSIRIVADDAGKPKLYEGFCVDISLRKEAELKAQQSQYELIKLWNAVEHSPATIVITDAAGAIQYVNPHFSQLTGYAADEVRGENPRILKSGVHSTGFFKDMWDTLLSGETWRGEICNRKKNGELYWEYASVSPIMDSKGNVTNFVAVKEDITERMRRDTELKRALSELEAIFNSSSVGIAYLDARMTFVRVNNRFSDLFGYTADSLQGVGIAGLAASSVAFGEWLDAQRGTMLRGEMIQADWQLRSGTGKSIWCSISARVLEDSPRGGGSIWVFDDITSRIELESMRVNVERIMRHDLKAPLNGIINLPFLVSQMGNISSEQQELLDIIQEAGLRMLEQVELSLDLYRMECGTYELVASRVDVMHVLRRATDVLGPTIRARRVNVVMRANDMLAEHGTVVYIVGNELLCYNTMLNLLKNAVEAAPYDTEVFIDVGVHDEWTSITIHNEGSIPEDIRPVFFEKYSTSGKKGGTGLGTYSARLMTENQGGRISVRSDDTGGVSVVVELPTAKAV